MELLAWTLSIITTENRVTGRLCDLLYLGTANARDHRVVQIATQW